MSAPMVKRSRPEMSLTPSSSPQSLICAIVIITAPGQTVPERNVCDSVRAADDGRVFAKLVEIIAPCDHGRAAAWRHGLRQAIDSGAMWIFVLDAGETLNASAFHMLAPSLAAYDVVWGGLEVCAPGEEPDSPRISKFAARTQAEFYHMALNWWVGGSHLIRTRTARAIDLDAGNEPAWFAAYLSSLWRDANCLKTAQPLTKAAQLPQVSSQDKAFLVDDLAKHACFIEIDQQGERLKLPYTGRNPALEREQLRGMFYEQADLLSLKPLIGEGACIVDVGANTGNHTLFFAKILKAATVIPIEPNPDTIPFLKAMITQNRLGNVDTSCLGVAVGAASGRAAVQTGRRGHLGTARMQAAVDGPVPVKALDQIISQKVDLLKIDVEDMEFEVLTGAENLIRRDHPILMIEVQDENLLPILDMTNRLGYTIREIFADFGYANYLLMPGAAEDRI